MIVSSLVNPVLEVVFSFREIFPLNEFLYWHLFLRVFFNAFGVGLILMIFAYKVGKKTSTQN